MQDEYFVPIKGYPNYEVSNFGRVVNVKHDRDMKLTPNTDGYLKVQLYHAGVARDFLVHRLVAQAFFLHYKKNREVNLLSDDKTDCSVGNIHLGGKKSRKGK